MGAFGAALIAKERYQGEQSTLVKASQLEDFQLKTIIARCKLCANNCLLTIHKFGNGESFISGNRCERGAGKVKKENLLPNLFKYKYERLFSYKPLEDAEAKRGRVGIPRVLNMYENYPFWFTFLLN